MAADPMTRISTALWTVISADATVRDLCDRLDRLVVPWSGLEVTTFPVLTYWIVSIDQIVGVGDPRRAALQLTAWAEGNNATTTAGALLDAALAALMPPEAWQGAGLDAVVAGVVWRGIGLDPEGGRTLSRADADIDLLITL